MGLGAKNNISTDIKSSRYRYYYQYSAYQDITDKPDWLDQEVVYSINNDGLNAIKDFSIEKPINTVRVVTLGDSFTFGQYVNTIENWPSVIERLIQKHFETNCSDVSIEVLNLGMPGYDVAYIVERYKLTGDKYNPDLILWFDPGTSLTRFNERMMPIIDECLEKNIRSTKLNDHSACWYYANEQVNIQYPPETLLPELILKIKDFISVSHTIPKEYIFFKSEYRKAESSLRSLFFADDFFAVKKPILIDDLEDSHMLADGHANSLGNIVIAEQILQSIQAKYTLCEL